MALLAGLALFVILLLLAKGVAGADVKKLANAIRKTGGALLALAALGLLVTGRFGFAVLSGSLAWALLMGQDLARRNVPPGGGAGGGGSRSERARRPRSSGGMSRREALQVLGLDDGASEADIRAAHRRLIRQAHPDTGGTSYLAAKINEAKDVLLSR